jgi:hypothetical protein
MIPSKKATQGAFFSDLLSYCNVCKLYVRVVLRQMLCRTCRKNNHLQTAGVLPLLYSQDSGRLLLDQKNISFFNLSLGQESMLHR